MDQFEKDEQAPPQNARTAENIILVGASGSGKSTTGALLSRFLGFGFVDTDQMVAKALGKDVAKIFSTVGEEVFRKEEERQVSKLQNVRFHVIATGGGTLESEVNREMLFGLGAVVWLHTPVAELAARLMSNEAFLKERPLLSDVVTIANPKERKLSLETRLKVLSDQRAASYRKADLEFSASYLTPDASAKMLKELLIERGLISRQDVGDPLTKIKV